MSYTIEYNRKCFKLDAGTVIGDARPLFGDTYFLFIQQGDNNVRTRPRAWCMESSGSHASVLSDVCTRAGACAGGDLQIPSGYTTPERYIARYRRVLTQADPLTLESLRDDLGIHSLLYTFLDPNMTGRLDDSTGGGSPKWRLASRKSWSPTGISNTASPHSRSMTSCSG